MIIAIAPDAPAATTDAILAAAADSGIGARAMADGRGGRLVGVDGTLPGNLLNLPGIGAVHASHKP